MSIWNSVRDRAPIGLTAIAVALFGFAGHTLYQKDQSEKAEKAAHEAQMQALRDETARIEREAAEIAAERERKQEQAREAARQAGIERQKAILARQVQRREEAEANRAALTRLQPIVARWQDAETLAQASPRIALPRQVEALQALRREFAAAAPRSASCMARVHQNILSSMDARLAMYISFLAQQGDSTTQAHATRSADFLKSVHSDITACMQP